MPTFRAIFHMLPMISSHLYFETSELLKEMEKNYGSNFSEVFLLLIN